MSDRLAEENERLRTDNEQLRAFFRDIVEENDSLRAANERLIQRLNAVRADAKLKRDTA
jgi:regulator of replication initiation timing